MGSEPGTDLFQVEIYPAMFLTQYRLEPKSQISVFRCTASQLKVRITWSGALASCYCIFNPELFSFISVYNFLQMPPLARSP